MTNQFTPSPKILRKQFCSAENAFSLLSNNIIIVTYKPKLCDKNVHCISRCLLFHFNSFEVVAYREQTHCIIPSTKCPLKNSLVNITKVHFVRLHPVERGIGLKVTKTKWVAILQCHYVASARNSFGVWNIKSQTPQDIDSWVYLYHNVDKYYITWSCAGIWLAGNFKYLKDF